MRWFHVESSKVYLLNELSANCLLALSIRKIHPDATDCVEIRRTSDAALQTFGFDSNDILDFAAISSWLGASTGTVRAWIDQSTNNHVVVQNTVNRQPEIQNTWASGLPTLRWFTVNTSFQITGITYNAFAMSYVLNHTDLNAAVVRAFATKRPAVSTSHTLIFSFTSNSFRITWDQANSSGGNRWNTGFLPSNNVNYRYLFNRPLSGTNRAIYVNGIQESSTSANPDVVNNSDLWLGNEPSNLGARGINSRLSEYLLFDSALHAADRNLLETSQSTFFG